jgi:hypothetical protein
MSYDLRSTRVDELDGPKKVESENVGSLCKVSMKFDNSSKSPGQVL